MPDVTEIAFEFAGCTGHGKPLTREQFGDNLYWKYLENETYPAYLRRLGSMLSAIAETARVQFCRDALMNEYGEIQELRQRLTAAESKLAEAVGLLRASCGRPRRIISVQTNMEIQRFLTRIDVEKIAEHFMSNPEKISELERRLREETPVDWDIDATEPETERK